MVGGEGLSVSVRAVISKMGWLDACARATAQQEGLSHEYMAQPGGPPAAPAGGGNKKNQNPKPKTQNPKPKTQAAQLGLETEGWQGAGATYCRFTVWSLFTRGSGWLKKSLSSPRVWAL